MNGLWVAAESLIKLKIKTASKNKSMRLMKILFLRISFNAKFFISGEKEIKAKPNDIQIKCE